MRDILKLLSLRDYKGCAEVIDIAKGKYKTPKSIKEVYRQFKRELAWL